MTTEPEPSDILTRVRDVMPGLKPAERRVAELVLNDPSSSSHLSITLLASRATTSETTVMRFCRSLGLTSYPQLRLALAGSAARESVRKFEYAGGGGDIGVTDSMTQVVDKIIYSEISALEDTRATLDFDALTRAVDVVDAAGRVNIIGCGASGFVAADLQQKLYRIGLVAFVWSDIHSALTAAALTGEDDVMIGISHSGETLDTIEPVRAGRDRGAKTVVLTNFSGSPITVDADIVLTTAARETSFRSGATASRIAQLAVVDALFIGVVQRRFEDASVKLTDTFDAVQPRRRS